MPAPMRSPSKLPQPNQAQPATTHPTPPTLPPSKPKLRTKTFLPRPAQTPTPAIPLGSLPRRTRSLASKSSNAKPQKSTPWPGPHGSLNSKSTPLPPALSSLDPHPPAKNNIASVQKKSALAHPSLKKPGEQPLHPPALGIVLIPPQTAHDPVSRPLTRARSKHLLGSKSDPAADPPQPQPQPPAPVIKKRKSRVLEIAQSYEKSGHSSQNSASDPLPKSRSASTLGGDLAHQRSSIINTPHRSVRPPSSFRSGTSSNESPNISALAETLSKQHVSRERVTRKRSSVSDMLRYSTMSTLSSLRWEDGAGGGLGDVLLLTDPNETQAMVADISLTEITPLKPETEMAALALANARAKFLSAIQNDEGLATTSPKNSDERKKLKIQNEILEEEEDEIEKSESQIRLDSPLVNMNLRRKKALSVTVSSPLNPKQATHGHSSTQASTTATPTNNTNSTLNQLIKQEIQLAKLTSELEKSKSNEMKLEQQLKKKIAQHEQQHHQNIGGTKEKPNKKNDQDERENLLIEELNRLENELNLMIENNIELENQLDLTKYENEQMKLNQEQRQSQQRTQQDRQRRDREKNVTQEKEEEEENELSVEDEEQSQNQDDLMKKIELKSDHLIKESQDEMTLIENDLMVLNLMNFFLSK